MTKKCAIEIHAAMVRIELWRTSDVVTMRAVNFSIRELVTGKVSVEKSDLSVFGTEDEGYGFGQHRVCAWKYVEGGHWWKSGHLWPR